MRWLIFLALVFAIALNFSPLRTVADQFLGSVSNPNVAGVGGSGPTYAMAYPDSFSCGATPCTSPSPIATSTTGPVVTKVISGVAGKNIYAFFLGGQSNGTNTALTVNYLAGTKTTTDCDTNVIAILPHVTTSLAPVAGEFISVYGGASWVAVTDYKPVPAAVPFVVPAGDSVCIETIATVTALYPFAEYSIH